MSALRISGSGSGFWPTPNARVSQDGEGLETWEVRRQRELAKGRNGNGMGTPLSIAALRSSWPTPSATDAEKRRDSARQLQRHTPGLEALATLWPTPRAEDAESAGNHPGAQDSLTVPVRLWPTPTSMDANASGGSSSYPTNTKSHSGTTLTDASVRQGFWQTPATDSFRSRGGERKDEMGLDQQARMWATPRAAEAEHSGRVVTGDWQTGLTEQATGHQHPTTCSHGAECRRVLNPLFVETLMGWPTGWTDCDSQVTGLCRWLRQWRTYIFERGYWRD